ncbi:MAG TPA: hypothetical protein DCR40_17995 [Prolixibacteraceae bacterium]|nr:hypothetical protein [Prolixibacteraceae bacterium]
MRHASMLWGNLLIPNSIWKLKGIDRTGWAENKILKFDANGNLIVGDNTGSMVYPGSGIPLSTGSAWGTSVTNNSANWNTAYGWGNHGNQGYANSILINGGGGENMNGFIDFIPGSGINITKTGSHVTIAATGGSMVYPGAGIALSTGSAWGTSITDNSANWNTAYGWGNHANAGYLTAQTSHADVVQDGDFASQGIMLRGVSSGSYSILTDASANWNAAYSNSGKVIVDGATAGYLNNNDFYWSSFTLKNHLNYEAPTSGGSKPVSSGGAFTALELKANLSGCTFTGQINGTSASFSGNVTALDFILSGSDVRLKTDIKPIQDLSWVKKVNLIEYRMKNDLTRLRYGVAAQELELINPDLVFSEAGKMKTVSYTDLLIAKVAYLEAEVEKLKSQINA